GVLRPTRPPHRRLGGHPVRGDHPRHMDPDRRRPRVPHVLPDVQAGGRLMGWQDNAACPGTDLDWFASRDQAACVAVCRACPVQVDCLLAAQEEETQTPKSWIAGVRGGLTAAERIDLYA